VSGEARRASPARVRLRDRFGGTEGNIILISGISVVLIALLVAEGVTVIDIRGLLTEHMFIGMVLIPPVVLKLATTGYRAVRYYTRSRAYRAEGPPRLPLRLLAPVLVAATIAVLLTGVLLLAAGHKSDTVLFIHQASFVVLAVVLVVHVFAYAPQVARSLRSDWRAARREAVPGAGLRGMLLAAALGGGVALALALLPIIDAWHGRH
jgi:hypothetical protein